MRERGAGARRGLTSAGRRGPNGRLPVSYSRKVFIPVTHLCRDTCHYCTFVTVPGKLRAAGHGHVHGARRDPRRRPPRRRIGLQGSTFHPRRPARRTRWDEARQWLDERGYDSTLDYVRAMAIRVLEETGLLPHLNPGVMSWSELSRLKPVAPSMGMMLETTSRRLFETKGAGALRQPRQGSRRCGCARWTDAGRLSIPFTTGLLVGIGETLTERAETMHAIRRSHKEFGHVQEVIVQNFRAKDHTAMAAVPDAGIEDFLATIAVTRLVLGPKMRIQAPPNLVSRAECLALIGAGVDDWGGVSPLTPDHVNPERPWPALDELADGHRRGRLRPGAAADRAAAVRAGRRGVDRPAGARARRRRWPTRETGLARRRQPGRAAVAGARRGRPSRWAAPTCTPRSTPRAAAPRPAAISAARSATGSRSARRCTSWRPGRPSASTPTCWRRCARPSAIRRGCSDDEYLALATADGPALDAVAALADSLRRDVVGDDVTFVVNRNINFTNICYTGCRFCAFAQRKGDADALLAVDRRGRRPGLGGARRRRDRGLHAGRHRPRTAGHRLRRSGARGQGAGAVDARARVLPDGDRQRRHQERAVASGSG